MTGRLFCSVRRDRALRCKSDYSRPSHGLRGVEGERKEREKENKRSGKRGVGGLRMRLQDFTEMEAVDAQAWICGVVQPSFLPPAAGGVCVHLSRCDPCTVTGVSAANSQNTKVMKNRLKIYFLDFFLTSSKETEDS